MIRRFAISLVYCTVMLSARAFAEDALVDVLRGAKERMHGKPRKVEAVVQGDKGFKVSGIIDGPDFDLTVETAHGRSRQIALARAGLVERGWLFVEIRVIRG